MQEVKIKAVCLFLYECENRSRCWNIHFFKSIEIILISRYVQVLMHHLGVVMMRKVFAKDF